MKRLTSEEGLTPDELEAIRKRVEKATEGPWFNSEATYIVNNVSGDSMEWNADLVAEAQTENDTTFIAHAREDIPKLLAEIERLRAFEEKMNGPLDIEGIAADGRVLKLRNVVFDYEKEVQFDNDIE